MNARQTACRSSSKTTANLEGKMLNRLRAGDPAGEHAEVNGGRKESDAITLRLRLERETKNFHVYRECHPNTNDMRDDKDPKAVLAGALYVAKHATVGTADFIEIKITAARRLTLG